MQYSYVQQNDVNVVRNNNYELKQSQNQLNDTSSSSTPMYQHILSSQQQQQQPPMVKKINYYFKTKKS